LPFKKQLCQLIRWLPVNIEKFYRDFTFRGNFSVKIGDKKLKLMNYETTVENEIFWKGIDKGWEPVSLQLWKQLAMQSKVALDVGANTGIYSLIASISNPELKVIGFEPLQRIAEKFLLNLKHNMLTNVIVLQSALSDKDGEAIFYDYKAEHPYSASLSPDFNPEKIDAIEVKMKTKKLDTIVEELQLNRIDLIKIDVEMSELQVLRGFARYLPVFKPTILIEVLTDEIGHGIMNAVHVLHYLFFHIDEIHPPQKVESIIRREGYNYLLCQESIARLIHLI